MSRRRNGTNRAAAMLGLSMYGPMNTGKRKRPNRTQVSVEEYKITHEKSYSR